MYTVFIFFNKKIVLGFNCLSFRSPQNLDFPLSNKLEGWKKQNHSYLITMKENKKSEEERNRNGVERIESQMADLSSNTTIITLCVNNYTQIKSKT